MKEKKEIKGVKDTNEKYTGHVRGIIKKILALVLALGMVITAAEALRMYNEWKASRTNDTKIENVEKAISFEDVKSIVEEYREALEKNDTETIEKLDKEVRGGKYFEALSKEFEKELIETLGLDPEVVEIVIARDGTFLVDKNKSAQKSTITSNGTINPWVKYIGEDGKNPKIPQDLKDMHYALGQDISFSGIRGIKDLESHFSNFEGLEDYEISLTEVEKDFER